MTQKNFLLNLSSILLSINILNAQNNVMYRDLIEKAYHCPISCNILLEKDVPAGYQSVAYTLQAKHLSNPFKKLSYFNKGTKMLEAEIAKDPTNIEWIFYRYIIQKEVPKILNYHKNIVGDRKKLEAYVLGQNSGDLYDRIAKVISPKKINNK